MMNVAPDASMSSGSAATSSSKSIDLCVPGVSTDSGVPDADKEYNESDGDVIPETEIGFIAHDFVYQKRGLSIVALPVSNGTFKFSLYVPQNF
jgi:hypothetical protein